MFDKNLSFSGRHADRLRKLAPSKIAGEQADQRLTIFGSYVEVLRLPLAALLRGRSSAKHHGYEHFA